MTEYYENRLNVGDIVKLSSLCTIKEDCYKDCEGVYNVIDDEVRMIARSHQLLMVISRYSAESSEYDATVGQSDNPRYKYSLVNLEGKILKQRLSYCVLDTFRDVSSYGIKAGDYVIYNPMSVVWTTTLSLFDNIVRKRFSMPPTFLGVDLLSSEYNYRKDYVLRVERDDCFYCWLSDGTKTVKELLIPVNQFLFDSCNLDGNLYKIGDAIYTYQRGTIYEEDVIIVAYNLLTDEVLVKNLDGVIWAPIHRCNLTYKSDIEKDSLITSFSDITDDSLKEALQVKSDTKKSFIQGTYFNSKIVHNKLKFNFKDENNQI